MKIMKILIVTQLFFCSTFCQEYFQTHIQKFPLKQTAFIKMFVGSLFMIYGSAQFGLSVPFFESVSYPRLSDMSKGGIFAGSGFALFESGLSNFRGEINFLNEPKSIIKHWDDHLKKAAKYSALITIVPMGQFLNR